MLTAADARELAKKYRNLDNRVGKEPRRKNLLNDVARSYSALASQLEMLEQMENSEGNKSDTGAIS